MGIEILDYLRETKKNNNFDSNILSDISKRILIVKGANEVERIRRINDENVYKFNCKEVDEDIFEIELINIKVGSYHKKQYTIQGGDIDGMLLNNKRKMPI